MQFLYGILIFYAISVKVIRCESTNIGCINKKDCSSPNFKQTNDGILNAILATVAGASGFTGTGPKDIHVTIDEKTSIEIEQYPASCSTPNQSSVCSAFDVLIGTNYGSILKTTSDLSYRLPEVKGFHNPDTNISALTRYKNSLLIGMNYKSKSSASIHMCSIDWNNLVIEDEVCVNKPLHESESPVRSLAVVNDILFFNLGNQDLHYCIIEKSQYLKTKKLMGNVSSVAYDSVNDKMYLLSTSGELLRCPSNPEAFSCEKMYSSKSHISSGQVVALHVAHDAVWMSYQDQIFQKCPLVKNENQLDCQDFAALYFTNHGSVIYQLSSRGRYLYAATGNIVWRCDPNIANSCIATFNTPSELVSFLIVN